MVILRPLRSSSWVKFGAFALIMAVLGLGIAAYVAATRPAPQVASKETTSTPIYEKLRVSVLGDSYTRGVGSNTNYGFAQRLSQSLCWGLNTQGEMGTGYVAATPQDGTRPFGNPERIAATVKTDPKLIIVQGSVNDAGLVGVRESALNVFASLRADAPDAMIVAVGPTAVPSVPFEQSVVIRDQVQAAADESAVPFIDPIELGWLAESTMYSSDNIHPTDVGYAKFAEELEVELASRSLLTRDACAPIS